MHEINSLVNSPVNSIGTDVKFVKISGIYIHHIFLFILLLYITFMRVCRQFFKKIPKILIQTADKTPTL